jgi:transposase
VVLRELAPYKAQLTCGIAVESTFNWYWLVDGLQAEGYPVTLVNPAKVGDYGGLKNTNDQTDGFWLAHLQRLKLLPKGYIYPKEQRGVRDVLRRRMMLVNQRTAHVLSFQSLVERQTGECINANHIKRLAESEVPRWLPADEPQLMGQTNVAVMQFLDAKIAAYEKAVLEKVKLRSEYEILLGLPGIGRILAMVIMLETGEISRFSKVGNYVSYCRCVNG